MSSSKSRLVAELSDEMRRMSALSVLVSELVACRAGLSSSDLECLDLVLAGAGKATPSDLVRGSGMTSGAITGVIDRLEGAGYVRRESDESDRRKTVLVPRMDRIEHLAQLYAPIQEAMTKLWSAYSLDQLRLLTDFARKSSDAAAKAMEVIRAMGSLPNGNRRVARGKEPQK